MESTDGKRRQYTEIVRGTKREAEARERALLGQRDNGVFVGLNRVTVGEFMAKWLASVRDKVYWNTYRGYEQRTRTHIIQDLGHVKLRELTPLHIEEAERRWLAAGNRRTGGPLDPRTVLHIHRVLHLAMERAIRWRMLAVNPVDGVEPPHVPDREADFLTLEESERLVAAVIGGEYELPILVGLYCGLRPAEYLALRWRDIDLDERVLRVTQNVHKVRANEVHEQMGHDVWGFRFGPAKTHRSRRPVTMPEFLRDLLRAWRDRQRTEQRPLAGEAWADLDLVFTDARGYPHLPERVRTVFYRALKAARLRKVVLYALRHTSASIVLHETKDLKLVAARLGHVNETLVLRTYGHLMPGADRDAADRLSQAVKRPASSRVQHECNTGEAEAGGDG